MHCLGEFIQLQVLLYFFRVEVVFFFAYFLGIEAVVPRLYSPVGGQVLSTGSFFIGQSLHVGYFFIYSGYRCTPYGFHQCQCIFWIFGHSVLQSPLRKVFVPQNLYLLASELQYFCYQCIVVIFISIISTGVVVGPYLLTQFSIGSIRQKRIHRRARVGDGILAFLSFINGYARCRFYKSFW